MTTFNAMIDDLGRIELPSMVTDILNLNRPGDSLTIEIELDKDGRPHILLITNYMKTEMPKEEKEELKTYTFYDDDACPRVIKISKEQDKFFDWLIDHDYIRGNVNIHDGLPEIDIEDLTK